MRFLRSRGLVTQDKTVGITNVILKFPESFSLPEDAWDFTEASDKSVFVLSVF